ncbi:DUF6582 domain-containing protein [Paractinoplanes hotanensis]|uniref:Rho termination factor N-terminal domain-containing protein n=1 Tax=Paractinoplanes hotanensis TaxID=2906497 RepID=A0ABT0Y9V2_9ACTN|nr:DUF6582 domain-containing protein [Actinoplanes hotanensis]MCM4082821.1 hypothetical protein [Actinoplanes hotanensis]
MATREPLDAEDRNAMPDSAFAFPRVRKEPLNDARHVRNALARFDQVRDVTDQERDEAFQRIKRAAAKFGVDMTEDSWRELGKPAKARRSSDKPRTQAPKKDLYAEAQRQKIPGRSTMTKDQLIEALRE